ncbi:MULTISPECIES: acyl-CoA dehydrogenase [unclassified Modicisalibacter]|uniref:acyl-CoA dehydrogenase n=1 Tax=unclassified Modicisalibacter TaxID=2679913 RepID=UPI001CCA8298|nr:MULTISPECIES: acyl-CoA dehydrogenase [unclassified Modicisalibacter]MBZ9556540.1 acyl-CoA dehydrogenase [Modicisalibacter sp. R2A 31.J]MBZ9574991.1 acyl-CoA dehydrogenase [Modicisalibacter sp. MOD 31.J]
MTALLLVILTVIGLIVVMRREAGAVAALAVPGLLGLVGLVAGAPVTGVVLLVIAAAIAACGLPALRRQWLSPRAFALFRKVAPKVSDTERSALEAGSVAWDGELFSGRPDWQSLLSYRDDGLSDEERAFIDHQCSVAAGMCNSWETARERADLPEALWEYLKKERFFGMIIPKEYGGLGFSAKAQSAVLQKLVVNETLMISVGVPNSLGPGELLLKYGTEAQKNHYLPRLADGREIPCFGLTGPRAGSDATSLPDVGVVCRGEYQGEEVLGLKLTFEKRWITLAPIATVVGLAFRMFDPDKLLGDDSDLGITCALIPRDTPGMEIGRRHHPIGSPFMNGPIVGRDVFIPLDFIIGGPEMAGHGWRMLVECLSVGRCITLPSGAAGVGRYASGWSGGFTRVRRQFNVPVAEMEGVQEPLARMTAHAYIAQAAVMQTANMIDHGVKPAVPSAILKSQLTEFQRQILADAMDVHGGKAVTLGPRNYLGLGWSAVPVSITVEGANIMTRNLMIFGQGAIRCHPYVLEELAAKDADDAAAFDKAFFGHVGLIFGNAARAFTQAFGLGRPGVPFDEVAAPYARDVARLSAGFSLCADAAMASLGSSLKKREMLSARLGDVLSNLYLISMVIKHWHETDTVEHEAALFHYSCRTLLYRAEQAFIELFDNLPNRGLATGLAAVVMPLGRRWKKPDDALTREIAQAISNATALRGKMLLDTWDTQQEGEQDNPLARYNALLADYPRAEPLYRTINKAYAKGELPAEALHPEQRLDAALEAGLIGEEDAAFMRAYEAEVLEMLTVDSFPFDAFATEKDKVVWHDAA